jgi:hypothetical protein
VLNQRQGDTEGNCQGKEAKGDYDQDQNHDQEIVNPFQKGPGSSLLGPFCILSQGTWLRNKH